MLIIDAAATAQALPFARLIPALRDMFSSGCETPSRQVLRWADGAAQPVTSLIMPAWQAGRYYGVKIINIAPGNATRGLPGLHASYLLHNANTGEPLALIDGNELTARRTAAASALAASFVARQEADRLLVIGGGRIARLLPLAYREVRDLRQVQAWARQPQQAHALAAYWREQGLSAQAVQDATSAAAQADIISCATLALVADEPVVRGAWLSSGSHLDLIGSFAPDMREADDAAFVDADAYVDREDALHKSGELLGPMSRGVFAADDIKATLAQLCRGDRLAQPGGRRTVFKSVGQALEDLCAGICAYEAVAGAAAC